jgi:hypothetical protein
MRAIAVKKFLPVIIVVVLVAATGIYLAAKPDSGAKNTTTGSAAKSKYSFKKACQALTAADAKQLLGNNISGGSTAANAATADIDVTTCAYTQQLPANAGPAALKDTLSATILVRAAKTDAGAQNNEGQFGPRKPADAQDVSGYGDKAYWSPAAAQLNILKRHNWYIISYGKIRPGDRTLDQTKKLADLVDAKL